MEFFTPRKLKFKAWNTESKLLMRLNSIDNNKGEFLKKDHILLQFTGLYDQDGEELYELDVVLKGSEKLIVHWSEQDNGWQLSTMDKKSKIENLKEAVSQARKLGNYFELAAKPGA